MKFSTNRVHLAQGLAQILSVAGSRMSLPVLSNVLIEAADGLVSFTATNLDVSVRCRIKGGVTSPGSVALPAKRLSAIVRELPAETVTLEVSRGMQVILRSGASIYRIPGGSRDDFPSLADVPEEKGGACQLKQDVFAQQLRCVAYAQCRDETRYIINATLLEFRGGRLTTVATDGRRLACATRTLEQGPARDVNLIIPARTIADLMRLLGTGTQMSLRFTDRNCAFRIDTEGDDSGLTGDVELISKLVDGVYPNYRAVLPKGPAQRLEIDRQAMRDALHRAALVCSEKSNAVTLMFSADLLDITAQSPEFGDAHEKLPITYGGAGVRVAGNPEFLMDPLRAFPEDRVAFGFKDETSPMTIGENDTLCVVMPVRL